MTSNIVTNNGQSPFDSIRRYRSDGSEYWMGRELMMLFGYPRWDKFGAEESPQPSVLQRAIISTKASNTYTESCFRYIAKTSPMPNGGTKNVEDCEMTRYAAYITAMCGDVTKPEIAMAQAYFAAKTREAEVVVPIQNDRLRELELENENLRLVNKNYEIQERMMIRQDSMLTIHGAPVVLALAGKSDQLIERETEVTEVVQPDTGKTDRILTAKQLEKVIKARTGQKLPSLKWFADELRKIGRDDLLVAVTRSQTSEYPIPSKVDEAIALVFYPHRQQLIGE